MTSTNTDSWTEELEHSSLSMSSHSDATLILGKLCSVYSRQDVGDPPAWEEDSLDEIDEDHAPLPLETVPVVQQKHLRFLRGEPTIHSEPAAPVIVPQLPTEVADEDEESGSQMCEFISPLSPKMGTLSASGSITSINDEVSKTSSWFIHRAPKQLPLTPPVTVHDHGEDHHDPLAETY